MRACECSVSGYSWDNHSEHCPVYMQGYAEHLEEQTQILADSIATLQAEKQQCLNMNREQAEEISRLQTENTKLREDLKMAGYNYDGSMLYLEHFEAGYLKLREALQTVIDNTAHLTCYSEETTQLILKALEACDE